MSKTVFAKTNFLSKRGSNLNGQIVSETCILFLSATAIDSMSDLAGYEHYPFLNDRYHSSNTTIIKLHSLEFSAWISTSDLVHVDFILKRNNETHFLRDFGTVCGQYSM